MKKIMISAFIISMSTIHCDTSIATTQESTAPMQAITSLSESQKIERWQNSCRDAATAAYSKHDNSGIITSFCIGAVGSLIIQGATLAAGIYCFPGRNPCGTCHASLDLLPRPELFAVPAALAGLIAAWYVNKNNNKHAARTEAFLEHLILAYATHPEELPEIVADPMKQLITYYQEFKKLPADRFITPLYLSIAAFADA